MHLLQADIKLTLHYQWLSDGTTKDTHVHDDGLSPSVIKALVTQTQRKRFFLPSASVAIFFHGKEEIISFPSCS